jgi:methylenetetrahydrofolate reductase (NADPH)
MKSQLGRPRLFSFEFFPPKTPQGIEKLRATRQQLAQLNPAFFSVTYGAGGSTREGTLSTVLEIRKDGHEAAPHLSCIASSKEQLREVIHQYKENGIKRIVALRGDMPSGLAMAGELRYASDLVRFVREERRLVPHRGRRLSRVPPAGAQAPPGPCRLQGEDRRRRDSAITQYFYNADSYFHFVDEAEALGIDVPIVPGIMPINNFSQLARFSDACGAEIPRWMRLKLEGFGDDVASVRAFGLDVVTDLCDRLLAGGAPGLHFYTLNQAGATSTLWQRLGL